MRDPEPPSSATSASESDARARWRRVERHFAEVVDLPPAERAAALARATDDPTIVTEVLDLIAVATSAPDAVRDLVAREAGRMTHDATGVGVGARLDAYTIGAKLGEGGMGAVYQARRDDGADGPLGPPVAIKVLLHANAQTLARFADERQILATLDHPGIVRLLDGGTTATGLPYLVMDHIDGLPLTRHARDRGLDVSARLELFLQVCAAIQYAHHRSVIHRDIKPMNILVTADGKAHLLDFGIAKLLDPHARRDLQSHTLTGMSLLTPEYASPEQARGGAVSIATDVYSLGAVLYELLTGEPAVRATTDPLELLRRICEVDPPRPSAVSPASDRRALAGALDDIVMKALHKDPAQRYATVADLAADIERHLAGLPVTARTSTFARRATGLYARHRGTFALALGLLVVVTLAIAWPRGDRIVDARAEATRPLVVAQEAPPPDADPAPRPIAIAPLRADVIVLEDEDGGTYVIRPGRDPRVFYGGRDTPGQLFEQAILERFADASSGRWTLSVWAPRVPGLEPGGIGRKEDGTFVRWCGSDHETRLVEVAADRADAILDGSSFLTSAMTRQPHLLARDDAGVYYYVDALREEARAAAGGAASYRVFVGTRGAMTRRPLTDVAIDPAGDVFATASGKLRIARDTTGRGATTVTWIDGDLRVPLAPLDPASNGRLIYAELGVYGFLGTICERR